MRPRVLLADDEPSVRLALRKIIEDQGCDVTPVADGAQALEALGKGGYQLVVTDLRMPEVDGMQVVRASRERDPNVPVVVLTAYGTVQSAVEAMRLGAANFLTKPFVLADVESVVREALHLAPRGDSRLAKRLEDRPGLLLVGTSPAISKIRSLVEQVADSDATVLLTGESGTGKEVVARLLHERSGRRRAPFIPVNCAAIPEPLLESELFGHARGSFTGATQARTGRFTLAAGGTLFLDEIAEMSPALQAKVLRVLQDKEVTPVGASHGQRIDVRIIAATNRNLPEMIDSGRFRDDLYYRINVIPIGLPPLRERAEDIPALCQHFLSHALSRRGRPPCELRRVLSESAVERLQYYPWPGNVRELENLIERVVLLRGEDEVFSAEDLPLEGPAPAAPQVTGISCRERRLPNWSLPEEGVNLPAELSRYEQAMIRSALERTGGNRKEAARILGLNRTTLVEKLKRLKPEEGDE